MFGIFKKKQTRKMVPEIKTPDNVFHTNSGMLCLWDYASYQHIKDYDKWDPEFGEDEDIARNIKSATFVPINIRSDGAYCVMVKLTELAELSPRELNYLTVTSQPYLLKTNGKIALSGIETVGNNSTDNIKIFNVESGEYVVRIHLIDWAEEPGSKRPDGKPTENALPDFIVFISPNIDKITSFRQDNETFRQQDVVREEP